MQAPIYVTLSPSDMEFATRIAKIRVAESVKAGRTPNHGYLGDRLAIDIPGAAGELAFCVGVGIKWEATVNTFKKPDALDDIQVRTSPCKAARPPLNFGNLIVRDDDSDDEKFVLVVGNAPYFVIKGWLFGRDTKKRQWRKQEANRPPAWFVPHQNLITDLSPLFDAVLVRAAA